MLQTVKQKENKKMYMTQLYFGYNNNSSLHTQSTVTNLKTYKQNIKFQRYNRCSNIQTNMWKKN